ncbi:hypothetical protein [Puia dinghuensis]|nr:hypothetical protein [Puia dinghuensis]
MEKPKITETTSKIVELLEPFEALERQRIVQASLTLLGDTMISPPNTDTQPGDDAPGEASVSSQAKIWMKQNLVSGDDLQLVFHLADGRADVIASEIPGKDGKAKTINAYMLQGLASFLTSGIPKFDDKSARALCARYGCYSAANHSVYIKAVGNKLTGSKDSGWTLTSPGLKYAAELVKGLFK